MGFCYMGGVGVARNVAESVLWVPKSADQGLVNAEFALGTLYYQGVGVKLDRACLCSAQPLVAKRDLTKPQTAWLMKVMED